MCLLASNTAGPSSSNDVRVGFQFGLKLMALAPYNKPHLTIAQQINLLKERGLIVTNDQAAANLLDRVGYYRLSGYWYPMRDIAQTPGLAGKISFQALDTFKQDSHLEHVAQLYVFDKKLRLLIADAIERIEVAIRVHIAHTLSTRSPQAHREPKELSGHFSLKANPRTGLTGHQEWLNKLNTCESRSKDEFAKHFNSKYTSPMPLWMSIELWDFGTLSFFLSGMKQSDKIHLAKKFNIPDSRADLIPSWIRSLNYIRNVTAHHSRLWNISPIDQPKLPKFGEIILMDHLLNNPRSSFKIYAPICIIQYINKTISPRSNWSQRLKDHMNTFPRSPHFAMAATGFPQNWDQEALWN